MITLTSVLGYNLKTALGTSTFIMTFTTLTGAVSHLLIGGNVNITALVVCIISALIGARFTALFANKADVKLQNRVTGTVLCVLGVFLAIVSKIYLILKKSYHLCMLPILVTGLLLTYGSYNINQIQRTEYKVTSRKLKNDYKIIFISDTHYGMVQKPDII